MGWEPIHRGKHRILGVHPDYKGLLEVEIDLNTYPPEGWADCFEHSEGVSISISMHRPILSGSTIEITPPDSELEEYFKHVDQRINSANTAYERRILPRIRAAEAAENRSRAEAEHRVNEAKNKLENL